MKMRDRLSALFRNPLNFTTIRRAVAALVAAAAATVVIAAAGSICGSHRATVEGATAIECCEPTASAALVNWSTKCLGVHARGDYYSVYIFDSNGTPQLISTDSYIDPWVYNGSMSVIGSVPNQAEGWIVNTNNDTIGFVDPSEAASEMLPP